MGNVEGEEHAKLFTEDETSEPEMIREEEEEKEHVTIEKSLISF